MLTVVSRSLINTYNGSLSDISAPERKKEANICKAPLAVVSQSMQPARLAVTDKHELKHHTATNSAITPGFNRKASVQGSGELERQQLVALFGAPLQYLCFFPHPSEPFPLLSCQVKNGI